MVGNLEINLIEHVAHLPDNWLIGGDSREFSQVFEQLFSVLTQWKSSGTTPKILLVERETVQFLASLLASCAANSPVFLGNYTWEKPEWKQVLDLVQPDLIWGKQVEFPLKHSPLPIPPKQFPLNNSPLIMIPTGGTSGQLRFTIHTWKTLMTSVWGFQEYFQVSQVNSFCVLPVYHVSGLMQFFRSFTTRGKLVIQPFKALEAGETGEINPEEFFISLVPTQLQRLLQKPKMTQWLSRFPTVLLGGSPAWPELLEAARRHRIRLAPTYGMTETASQIATLKPDNFLAGNNSCGKALPHANITICTPKGEKLANNQIGTITISAESLALGYYPDLFNEEQQFSLDDLGFLDENNDLHIVGRSSDKIITGGENVFPAQIESAILATDLVADICVIGLPDRHWGQVVTAVYIPSNSQVESADLQTAIQEKLSKFKQPKYWVAVESLPRNQQGKVKRDRLQEIALKWLIDRGAIAPL